MEVHERLGILLERDLPASRPRTCAAPPSSARPPPASASPSCCGTTCHLLEASDELDRFLREADDYDLHWDAAHAPARPHGRDLPAASTSALGALRCCWSAIPAWQVYRRLRGASLTQLLERAPKSFPEVARILSLIRHEILKHNTSFLSDVGRALEMDEPDAEARAAVVAARLFGEPRGTAARPRRRRARVPARARDPRPLPRLRRRAAEGRPQPQHQPQPLSQGPDLQRR